jgi:hypothetical protein
MNPVLGAPIWLNAMAPVIIHVIAQLLQMLMNAHGEQMKPAHQFGHLRGQFGQGDAAWYSARSNVLLSMHMEDDMLGIRFFIPGIINVTINSSVDEADYNFQWLKDWLAECWARVEQ